MKKPPRPPRLFVSYSHDSPEHDDKVLGLCDRLRAHGIDAWLDQYENAPPEGWPRWRVARIREADFVLVVCTEIYERRFRAADKPGEGLGVTWEGNILTQELYDSGGRNKRIIPVLFFPATPQHVPDVLRGATRFEVGTEEGFWRLYRHLTGQPQSPAPPLGTLTPLPPRVRQFAFEPAPRYEEDRSRRLAEKLEMAYRRRAELTFTGQDTRKVQEEILRIRRELREGGRLVAGDLLDEARFKLIEPIGSGGFATVWKAYDRKRSELVAVKVLHGLRTGDRTYRERFFRGARQMAELQHPGIVRVIEPHREEGGHHFFVLEYVSGGDFRQAVLASRLQQAEALAIILQVGEALTYAHQRDVFHRDVKPANILLDGLRPKLTDFDLVRAFDTTGGTQTQGMLGTFLYSAPEMMSEPREAGAAADVYSLAMTTIFTLHGKELPSSVLREPERFVQSLACTQDAKKLLIQAISVEPTERQSSIAEFCRQLQYALPVFAAATLVMPKETYALPLRTPRRTTPRSISRPLVTEEPPLLPVSAVKRRKLWSAAQFALENLLGLLLLVSIALVLLQRSPARISGSTVLGAFGNYLDTVLVHSFIASALAAVLSSVALYRLFLLFRRGSDHVRQRWNSFILAREERRRERGEKERIRRSIITKHMQRVIEERQKREEVKPMREPSQRE